MVERTIGRRGLSRWLRGPRRDEGCECLLGVSGTAATHGTNAAVRDQQVPSTLRVKTNVWGESRVMGSVSLLSLALATAVMVTGSLAYGQTTQDIDLGDGALGRYRLPAGPLPEVGFIAVHRTSDYRNHVSTTELQARGYATLGIKTRFPTEASVNWELIALDVRNAMRFLKSQGIKKVFLIAHSGGGPTMGYYEALMENGPSYCKGKNKLVECTFTGKEFRRSDRADGVIFLEAHGSNPLNRLRELNAAVFDEEEPFAYTKESLNPFNPANGYNPTAHSVYSEDFLKRYFYMQSRRMDGLIKDALRIKREIELGERDPNDNAFVIYRAQARLADFSLSAQPGTKGPAKLVKNDGSIVLMPQVTSVRVPNLADAAGDSGELGIEDLTVTSFLSAAATRSNDSDEDVDWCSSNSTTLCAVQQISVPILVINAQGHYFVREGEMIYQMAKSRDKDFYIIEGMNHGLNNCTACANYWGTGPYTNVPTNLWNLVNDWIVAHTAHDHGHR